MDLAEVHEELVEEIRHGMGYVMEPALMEELGDVFDTMAAQLEGLALCHLFELADVERFRENMVRSGHSRRFFLRRSREQNNLRDRHLALSRNRAFLDTLIAGMLPVARDIASLSIAQHDPAWEYADDFYFYQLLHELVKQPHPFPTPETHLLLSRFEGSLQGGPSLQFDVCRALVQRDASAFADALTALVEGERAQIEKDRSSAAVHERDILFWPKSRASLEGLALLKAAELVGLSVQGDFALCPALARLPFSDAPVRDLFEEIERLG